MCLNINKFQQFSLRKNQKLPANSKISMKPFNSELVILSMF